MPNLKELGIALKAYRVAVGESIEEVSEATELDLAVIQQIESGSTTPNVDTLELMARHFLLREQEVNRLLTLAGYKTDEFKIDLESTNINIDSLSKDFDVLVSPVFYTDMVNIVSNQYGLTINFIQNGNQGDKPVVISRIGMSHVHAESIIKVLEETIKQAKKQLGPETGDQK